MTWCTWPTFHAPLTLSKFYVKSRIKVHISAAAMPVGMKPCIDYSSSKHHDPFFAWPTLHAVVISPKAGAISTSAEFLFHLKSTIFTAVKYRNILHGYVCVKNVENTWKFERVALSQKLALRNPMELIKYFKTNIRWNFTETLDTKNGQHCTTTDLPPWDAQ